ncbi:autotransporter outer membrane beta-barrel domain-containing protein [Erwinia sp. V71]|uniref:autotransporter outer membrane beta-barrel domain-containing protein n=1 Tax=Erwinia sp. V71 TaxID=3369424 RepID=UPI003F5E5B56
MVTLCLLCSFRAISDTVYITESSDGVSYSYNGEEVDVIVNDDVTITNDAVYEYSFLFYGTPDSSFVNNGSISNTYISLLTTPNTDSPTSPFSFTNNSYFYGGVGYFVDGFQNVGELIVSSVVNNGAMSSPMTSDTGYDNLNYSAIIPTVIMNSAGFSSPVVEYIENNGSMSGYNVISNISYAYYLNNSTIVSDYEAYGVVFDADTFSTINELYNYGEIVATNYGVYNSTDSVLGYLYNYGSFTSDNVSIFNEVDGVITKIDNYGVISGGNYSIYNAGSILDGVYNRGTLDGDVYLNDAVLNLLYGSSVYGDIIGGGDSILNIGSSDESVSFTTNGDADVGTININEESTLNLSDGATWSAEDGGIINYGNISLDSSGTYATLIGDTINNGSIILNSCSACAGYSLTIDGDYVGNDGILYLGTVLGDDSSLTDKLIITGHASGTTSVVVTNENGSGAETVEGIEIISTGSSDSDAFVQSGRVVAGVYEYSLVQGNSSGNNENKWYLTSIYTESSESSESSESFVVYRPEVASYIANLLAANTLFNTRWYDHTQYSDSLELDGKDTSMWMRNVATHERFRVDDNNQSKTSSNSYVLQLGGDLIRLSGNGENIYNFGLMGGYANQKNSTRNHISGYSSNGKVDGYSVGVYGNYYQDGIKKDGVYVDGWVQYSWFNNEVKGDFLLPENYKSRGFSASIEYGHNYQVGSYLTVNGMRNDIYINPQAQFTWMNVKSKGFTDSNGDKVSFEGDGNIQSRVGFVASLKGKSILDESTVREFNPFVEVNWLHNTERYGVSINNEEKSMGGWRNVGEVKLGVKSKVMDELYISGSVGQQIGGSGYSATSGVLSIKYFF